MKLFMKLQMKKLRSFAQKQSDKIIPSLSFDL